MQRAKARAQYANMSRMKMAAGTASVRKYRIKLELLLNRLIFQSHQTNSSLTHDLSSHSHVIPNTNR